MYRRHQGNFCSTLLFRVSVSSQKMALSDVRDVAGEEPKGSCESGVGRGKDRGESGVPVV